MQLVRTKMMNGSKCIYLQKVDRSRECDIHSKSSDNPHDTHTLHESAEVAMTGMPTRQPKNNQETNDDIVSTTFPFVRKNKKLSRLTAANQTKTNRLHTQQQT